MGLTQNLGRLSPSIFSDASLNIGVGAAPSGSYKFEVTGTSKVSGVLTLGSTLSNGTYTYTLPAATGTLALVGGAGVGTVTSVAALTIGTTGTDLSSTVANSTTTPVITLNVPTASAANRGALSSADWTTFNGKQAQLNGTGFVKVSGTVVSYDNSTYVTSAYFSATNPLIYSLGNFSIDKATTIDDGYLSKVDFNIFNNKQATITLTTTGTSGVATFSANTLNIPNYGSALSGYVPYTGATANLDLGAFSLTTFGVSSTNTISTTAGYGILSGGGGFSIGPSATRGIIAINGSGDQLLTFSTQSYIYNSSSLFRMLSSSDIDFVAGGTQRLLISASTGAATFYSSVRAQSGFIKTAITSGSGPSTPTYENMIDYTEYGISAKIEGGNTFGWNADTYLKLSTSAGNVVIGPTGAATFSSSVTASEMFIGSTSGFLTLGSTTSYGRIGSGGGGVTMYLNGATRGGGGYAASGTCLISLDGQFAVTDSSTAVTKFRVETNGNVLIGTTTDDTINKLQVSGGIYSSNYNTNFNSVTINSSTNVNTAVLDIGIVCFRDAVNGGGCLVFYENGQTPVIVSQSGGTTFTTSSPSATQIQISNRSGSRGLQALGGSSRNSVQLIWSVFRITGLSA